MRSPPSESSKPIRSAFFTSISPRCERPKEGSTCSWRPDVEIRFVELHERATTQVAADFMFALIKAVPYKIHTVLTDNGTHFTDPGGETWTPSEIKQMLAERRPFRAHAFEFACARADRPSPDQAQTSLDH